MSSARMLELEAVERLLEVTDGRAGDQPVSWHAGFRHNIDGLALMADRPSHWAT